MMGGRDLNLYGRKSFINMYHFEVKFEWMESEVSMVVNKD